MRRTAEFERFNLRHLRYFLAVCENGSFRAASARLNIAQSAVSRRVADLERIFDLQLLERHPRGVSMTPAGAVLRESALKISGEIDEAHHILRRYERGEEGVVTAGFFGTTARLGFVPELIGRFKTGHPDIALDMRLPLGPPNEAALAPLDIAFAEEQLRAPGRKDVPLFAGRYMLALPRTHRLVALGYIRFADLYDTDMIGIPQSVAPAIHDALVREAAQRGRALDIVHEAESECARLAFAAAGMGVAIVSPLAINHEQNFEVEYRALADFVLPFDLWLNMKPEASGATARLVDIAQALLAELPALSSE